MPCELGLVCSYVDSAPLASRPSQLSYGCTNIGFCRLLGGGRGSGERGRKRGKGGRQEREMEGEKGLRGGGIALVPSCSSMCDKTCN